MQGSTHTLSSNGTSADSLLKRLSQQSLVTSHPVTLSSTLPTCDVSKINTLSSQVKDLSIDEQIAFTREVYHDVCLRVYVPKDFIDLSIRAMKKLQESGRSNVLYELSLGLGTLRPDGSDSCFPTSRMPMGLLEYMAQFFASETMNEVCYF